MSGMHSLYMSRMIAIRTSDASGSSGHVFEPKTMSVGVLSTNRNRSEADGGTGAILGRMMYRLQSRHKH